MARNHYVPQLLLRQFAENDKVKTYDVQKHCFHIKKIKNTFYEEELFPEQLEQKFAQKLEGPFGDLLNHKLLAESKTITIDRRENMLIRKFFLVQSLRSVYFNQTYDDMLCELDEKDNPCAQFIRHFVDADEFMPSSRSFISDLEMLMEYDSIEDLLDHQEKLLPSLWFSARQAYTAYYAIWDAAGSGQEFLFPKLQGIGLQDLHGPFYKTMTLLKYRTENREKISYKMDARYRMARSEAAAFVDNYGLFPISPTRALVGISSYFKAFFPQQRGMYGMPYIPALLPRRQFQYHFYDPTRIELFEPCNNRDNRNYTYQIKDLTKREVLHHNALVLNEEQEEFAFHDYDKIRESFWAYEHQFTMRKKKHDYSDLVC